MNEIDLINCVSEYDLAHGSKYFEVVESCHEWLVM